MRISARNKLHGTVTSITHGDVDSKIVIQLKGTPTVTAVVTREALEELGLSEGDDACAVVKASSVLIGTCQEGKACCKK